VETSWSAFNKWQREEVIVIGEISIFQPKKRDLEATQKNQDSDLKLATIWKEKNAPDRDLNAMAIGNSISGSK
jgi:hypothetical protein